MSLDIGPDRPTLSRSPEAPAGAPEAPTHTPGGNPLTPAVAALSPQRRDALDTATLAVSTHLEAIRGGATPPPRFAEALAAYDQMLAGVGVPVSDAYADVRATLRAPEVEQQRVGPQEPALTGGAAKRREAGERAGPEEVALALETFQGILAPGREVTRTDINRLTETVRASASEDMRAVYDGLSGPERERWSALMSGTSTDERSALYGMLVQRFDRQHLLTFAYYNTHAGSDNIGGRLLGEAVARNAPEATTEAFVRDAATYAVPPEKRLDLQTTTATLEARPEIGMAAAAAFSGLTGPAMDRALDAVRDRGMLDAVVQSAVTTQAVQMRVSLHDGGGELTIRRTDADVLGRLLVAASGSQNALAKASLVDVAGRALGRAETGAYPGESVETIRSGITTLISADPVGVLENYSRQIDTDGDNALTDYFESMVRSGQIGALGQIVADLSTGDGAATSSGMWAVQTAPDSNLVGVAGLVNANTLGYTVGSIGRAIERTSESARERARYVEELSNGATAVAGLAGPSVGGTVLGLSEIIKSISNSITDDTVQGNDALIDDLTVHFTPRFSGQQGASVTDAVLKAYTDAIVRAMNGPATRSEYDRLTDPPSTFR